MPRDDPSPASRSPTAAGAALVTAVVPTHGRPDFLERALRSVVAQTWPSIEIVVVDDNGRGTARQRETAAVVAAFDAGARTLRYLVNETNGGGGFARNAGVAAAGGEFLAFLDDDDEWLPRFVERGVRTLEDEAADVVYCDCLVVDDGRRERARHEVNVKHAGDVRAALTGGWCPSSTSLFVLRRGAVDAVDGPFDPALASFQDYDCWLGLSAHARFAFHEEPLVLKHRHRAGQITSDTGARRGALEHLAAKWRPRLVEAERPRFDEALAALEHDILRMEYRNALHGRRWRRAADRAWRYATGRGSALRNAVALLRASGR